MYQRVGAYDRVRGGAVWRRVTRSGAAWRGAAQLHAGAAGGAHAHRHATGGDQLLRRRSPLARPKWADRHAPASALLARAAPVSVRLPSAPGLPLPRASLGHAASRDRTIQNL